MNWIEHIIEHQCEAIGIPRDAVDPYDRESQWFMEYSWTKEMEEGFVDWLANELYTQKEMRHKIMFNPYKDKKRCKQTAEQWVWNYGWKTDV